MPLNNAELAIILRAVDEVSAPIRRIQEQVESFSGKVREAGEAMRSWGERTLIDGALVSEMGEKMTEAVSKVIEPAMESQDAMAKIAAAVRLTTEETEKLEAASVAYSNTHVGSEEVYKATSQAFLQQKEALGGVEAALKATDVAMKLASATDSDARDSAEVLTTIYQTMADKTRPAADQIRTFGDVIAATREKFAIADPVEFRQGLAAIAPIAGALKVSLPETAALIAQVQQAIGTRGVRSFAQGMNEVLANAKKIREAGINTHTDFIGILEQVQARFDRLGSQRGTQWVEATFGGAARGILAVLPHLNELENKIGEVGNSKGALDAALARREDSAAEQWKIFTQELHNFEVTVGATVLPAINSLVTHLKPVLAEVAHFAETHQTIVKWTLGITAAVGAVTTLAGVLLATAGTVGVIAGNVTLFATGFATILAILNPITIATKAWTAAQWLLNAAMDANPVGATIVAVAGLAYAAYEVYENWSAIAGFFGGLWDKVKGAFDKIVAAVSNIHWFDLGVNIITSIASGIKSAVMHPVEAIKGVVSRIRDFLPHSPAKEGPLRDLHETAISEEVARSIRPGPVVAAMRKLTAAAAAAAIIAAPTLATPVFSAEGPQYYQQAYKLNAPYAVPGPYATNLPPAEEKQFRTWVEKNHVPFNPNELISDYDMRGFWQAMQAGKVAAWKGKGSHFPDTFKTPYDTTFSAESKYALPNTPRAWRGDDLVDTRTGQLIFSPPKMPTADVTKVTPIVTRAEALGREMRPTQELARLPAIFARMPTGMERIMQLQGVEIAAIQALRKPETPIAPIAPLAARPGPPITIYLQPNIEINVGTDADGKVDPEEIGRVVNEHIRKAGRDLHEVLAREDARRRRTEFH